MMGMLSAHELRASFLDPDRREQYRKVSFSTVIIDLVLEEPVTGDPPSQILNRAVVNGDDGSLLGSQVNISIG